MGNLFIEMKLLAVLAASAVSSVPLDELAKLKKWGEEHGVVVRNVDDSATCVTTSGDYGAYMICPTYYAATGMCASGKEKDCPHGVVWQLTCCNLESSAQSSCDNLSSDVGGELKCGTGKIIAGGCTGGSKRDCHQGGGDYSYQSLCCDFAGVTVLNEYSYQIPAANYGSYIECPFGYVMNGMCAGGKNKDCRDHSGGETSHFIDCVAYSR